MSDNSNALPDLMTGSRGKYRWLTSTRHTIDNLLALCPELVFGKYLAVTSSDSGPLQLSELPHDSGWQSRNGIAYSPQIVSLDLLPPHDLYDEWYVFQKQTDLGALGQGNIFEAPLSAGQVETFVNFGSFVFEPIMSDIEKLFWQQLEWVRPYAYISEIDSCRLTVVCSNETLVAAIDQKLRLSVH